MDESEQHRVQRRACQPISRTLAMNAAWPLAVPRFHFKAQRYNLDERWQKGSSPTRSHRRLLTFPLPTIFPVEQAHERRRNAGKRNNRKTSP